MLFSDNRSIACVIAVCRILFVNLVEVFFKSKRQIQLVLSLISYIAKAAAPYIKLTLKNNKKRLESRINMISI